MEQQEKIFQLYIQRLSGNLTPEEESYVQRMLAQDKAFQDTWAALESRGQAIGAGQYVSSIDPEAGLEALRRRKRVRVRNIRTGVAVAASLLVLVAAGAFWLTWQRPVSLQQFVEETARQQQVIRLTAANGQSVSLHADSTQNILLGGAAINAGNGSLQYTAEGADTAQNLLTVPAGEQYRLVLSDGTEVYLNSSTSLRFPFNFGKGNREVRVEGEAFFKVAKDPARRFIVHTPQTQVQVYGTSFNVNTYREQEKTALVEGSVWLQAANGQRSELKPGFLAASMAGKGFEMQPFEKDEVLSWMNGVYYFHKMPVTQLVQEASRFYGVKFVLESDKFAGLATTGLMDRARLSEFLTDLQITAGAEFRFGNGAVYLK